MLVSNAGITYKDGGGLFVTCNNSIVFINFGFVLSKNQNIYSNIVE